MNQVTLLHVTYHCRDMVLTLIMPAEPCPGCPCCLYVPTLHCAPSSSFFNQMVLILSFEMLRLNAKVHFICQVGWPMVPSQLVKHYSVGFCEDFFFFLDEINSGLTFKSVESWLPQHWWASANQLKAIREQSYFPWERRNSARTLPSDLGCNINSVLSFQPAGFTCRFWTHRLWEPIP